MGKKEASKQVTKTDYRMSIHFGVCIGPVDYLRRIYIGEKIALEGFYTGQQSIALGNYEFFGGVEHEGGIEGLAWYLPGASDQILDADLRAKYALDEDEMPGYRGLTSVYFTENAGFHPPGWPKGFWWGQSPYIQSVWVEAARTSYGLDAAKARIYRQIFDATGEGTDFGNLGGGNEPRKWDTLGDWAVRGGAPGTPFTIINLSDNSVDETWETSDPTQHSESVHITEDGELVTKIHDYFLGTVPTELEIVNLLTLTVKQTIDLDAYEVTYQTEHRNGGFVADDIIMLDGSRRMLIRQHQVGIRHWWMLLTKPDAGSNWTVEFTGQGPYTTITDILGVSLGRRYGYAKHPIDVGYAYRIDCDSYVEDIVQPAGIGSRDINLISYLTDTDEVLVVCTNGDLLIYNKELTTLRTSRTGLGATIGDFQQGGGKRIELGFGRIALVTASAGNADHIYVLSITSLSTILDIDVSTTDLVNKSSAPDFININSTYGGAFVGSHSLPSSFWPFSPVGDFDTNPAHRIYEAMVEDLGASPSSVDFDNHQAVASVLYAERFGISYKWGKQTPVEDEVREILDHIEATYFLHPRTGLMTLKLIRNDYVVASLPIFDATNSRITNFKRRLWGETTNELTVSYTEPVSQESVSITVQDGANIAVQRGEIIPDTRDYYMIRRADLITKVAWRDLRAVSTPLASCDIEASRDAWDVVPGDCIVINSPEDGVEAMVMRVGPIDYGSPNDAIIKASLVEDVFALAIAEYDDLVETEWEDPTQDPEPADDAYGFTMPYFFAANRIPAGSPFTYPNVYAAVLAASSQTDVIGFQLWGERPNTLGDPVEQSLGEKSINVRVEIETALVQEAESTVPSTLSSTIGIGPTVGGFAIIGDGDETEVEIALVTAVDGTSVTLARGVLDTTPKDWPIGTRIFYVNGTTQTNEDTTPRSVAEDVDYQILIRTSAGLLGSSTVLTVPMTARPHLPSRPADCQVNGEGFGLVDIDGVDPIPISVAERNRLTEDSVVLAWDDATVTPQVGQTWQLVLMQSDRTVITTITGLTGISYMLDPADFAGATSGIIRFEAELDGDISMQAHEIAVTVATGYGIGYGYNYGGA